MSQVKTQIYDSYQDDTEFEKEDLDVNHQDSENYISKIKTSDFDPSKITFDFMIREHLGDVESPSPEETMQDLTEYIDQGKPESLRNEIALKNIGLMYGALNNRGYRNLPNRDFDEIVQEAFIVMLKAIENYDPDRGANFSTYLYMTIGNALRKTLEFDINCKSLDEPIKSLDNESATIGDTIPDERANVSFENIDDEDEKQVIMLEIRKSLSDIRSNIVAYNFGIEKKEVSRQKIAEILGVSVDFVNRELYSALDILRKNRILRNIYDKYNSINYVRSGSIIEYASKTNRVPNKTEAIVMRRLELEEDFKKAVESFPQTLCNIERGYTCH